MPADILVPWLLTNAFSLLFAVACWRWPNFGRVTAGALFALAGAFNAYLGATDPEVYATGFRSHVWFEVYRQVIDHLLIPIGTPFILAIAAGQLVVAGLLWSGGQRVKLGVIGAVTFLLAITPLGLGSAVPGPLVMAIGVMGLWRHDFVRAAADRAWRRPA